MKPSLPALIWWSVHRLTRLASMAMMLGVASAPAVGQDAIDPEADRILRAMTGYLGGLAAFSVAFDDEVEIVTYEGQKLQLSSSGKLLAKRPDKLRVSREGELAGGGEAVINGASITLLSRAQKVFAMLEGGGTIDEAIETIRSETGIDAAGGDLIYADAYPGLMTDVTRGDYYGGSYVAGIEAHHLAFRSKEVDWQIWVQAGDTPLPLKYIITSKWITGAPQYSVRLRDWQVDPLIDEAAFSFTAPEGARQVDSIVLNELDQLVGGEAN
jgi:hypothetical protein